MQDGLGLAKTILQGTVKRGGGGEKGGEDKADKGRGGKTTSGNGQAWSTPVPEGGGEQGKMEEAGCEIICGAQRTPSRLMDT